MTYKHIFEEKKSYLSANQKCKLPQSKNRMHPNNLQCYCVRFACRCFTGYIKLGTEKIIYREGQMFRKMYGIPLKLLNDARSIYANQSLALTECKWVNIMRIYV